MNATVLTPEQFGPYLQQQPAPPNPRLADLRQSSHGSEGIRPADALSADTLGVTEHDPRQAVRQSLKILLAGHKLHASLVAAALNRPVGEAEPSPPPPADVAAWVERTAAWITATTEALAQRWGPSASGGATTEPLALSDYHRYDLARTLVEVLERHPGTAEQVTADQMATYLAAAESGLPQEPPAPAWVSAGADMDRSLAWSRALARILETAVDTPFNRPLETVLTDARAALAEAVSRALHSVRDALALPEDAQRVVEQHLLQTSSRLYAATLRHVHQESARMIERYQALQAAGDLAGADELAHAYQDRRLGYAGVAHHFQTLWAVHAAQQNAALAMMVVEPSPNPPPPIQPPADPSVEAPADLVGRRPDAAVRASAPAG